MVLAVDETDLAVQTTLVISLLSDRIDIGPIQLCDLR